MNLIVAVDEKWGIGCDNDLLASIPGDMQYFKEKTTDGVGSDGAQNSRESA